MKILLIITLMTSAFAKSESIDEIFESVWSQSKSQIYPQWREKKFFSNVNKELIKKKISKCSDLDCFSDIYNSFLKKLNVSHTSFYTKRDQEFYVFSSLFNTKDITQPKVNHIGVQFKMINDEYYIREILTGYPAHKAGLRRGDKLLSIDGRIFKPQVLHQYSQHDKIGLEYLRDSKVKQININIVSESPHFSFLEGMKNSLQIFNIKNKKIAYVRLWAGTNTKFLDLFLDFVKKQKDNTDGLILDLRGGFGGAWYDYLDPFFKDRSTFFKFSIINRKNEVSEHGPGNKKINWTYVKPMVVLINEGVRSGKEALAYQFKKTRRAILLGEKTWGAFTGGKAIYQDPTLDYFLYLAVFELLLDGQKIEGIGIEPDIKVSYPVLNSLDIDPQLEKAKNVIISIL